MKAKLEKTGNFIEKYRKKAELCQMCPVNCKIHRKTQKGNCGETFNARVASINLHFGEEPPVSGTRGSGTVFFSGCNLHCIFCQNYPISQLHQANQTLSEDDFAFRLIELQKKGAHNINFVTPSHFIFQMVEALNKAFEKGLNIPVLFNTSGYDKAEIIKDLEGIVDLWLPDAKYASNDLALRYSGSGNYVEVNRKALLEIYKQNEGKLILDEHGIAQKGMIIRHLVLPGQVENSIKVLDWIRKEMGRGVHLSIMSQYFPAYKALKNAPDALNRKVLYQEYEQVIQHAESLGFTNGWFQELEAEP